MSTMNVNKAKSLFDIKKEKILRLLAVPFESYTDQSPKGSIDVGIRPLIDNINQLEGIVTTSSCAGRISVYLEGSKATKHKLDDDSNEAQSQSNQRGVPGGKGRGGRWLFVSHDPVHVPERRGLEDKPLSRLLGLSHRKEDFEYGAGQARYVRFQFEPMVSLEREIESYTELKLLD